MRYLLLLLLSVFQLSALPAFVNATSGPDSVTTVVAVAQNVSAGNLLFVGSRAGSTNCTGLTATISDTAGNTFILIGYFTSYTSPSSVCDGLWYVKNTIAAAADVTTIVWSSVQSDCTLNILQFSGLDTVAPLDSVAVNQILNGSGTTATSSQFSTVVADEAICVFAEWRGSGTISAGTGFTQATNSSGVSGAAYKIASTLQTNATTTMTNTASAANGIAVVTFKVAPVTAGTVTYVTSTPSSAPNNNYVTSFTTTASKTTTGNLLSVFVRMDRFSSGGAAQTCTSVISSITDTASNTYAQVGAVSTNNAGVNAGECIVAFIAKNITGNAANILTVNMPTALRSWAVVSTEVSGLNTGNPFDATANASSTSANTLTTSAFTTKTTNQILLEAGCQSGSITYTPGSGYQIPAGATVASSTLSVGYKVVSTVQTAATATMGFSATDRSGLLLITLSQTDPTGKVRHRAISQ